MHRLPTLAAAGLMATAGVLAPTTTASATTADQAWGVPRHATITIKGHGYGHGRGLSQYGAQGAARQGVGYRKIVGFYYPGTRWGVARGRVSVLISGDTSDDLVVLARRRLSVRDTAGGGRIALPRNGATRWRVAVNRDGVNRVSYLTGRWHRWRALKGQGEFYAGGKPITLVTPSEHRAYRGRLRVAVTASGDRVTVNDLLLDHYLKGVVPREMPASWKPAAVRSQAVAARTYAAYERAHPLAAAYQICDTASCQVYGGYTAEYDASNAAIKATAHQILRYNGHPAFTQFSSSSGGWTAAGSAPYLRAKRDPYDAWPGNPVHSWSVTRGDRALEHAWPRLGNLRRIVVLSRDGNGDWGGRIRTLKLVGGGGSVRVSGDTFRSVLGLRSTWVTFAVARRH